MKPQKCGTSALILVILILGLISCAHVPKPESPKVPLLSHDARVNLGIIAVVSASFQPEFICTKPMGKNKAAATGAAVGALGCIAAGGYSGHFLGAAAGIAISPVCALVGGVWGAVEGVPEAKQKETQSALVNAAEVPRAQEAMRNRILTHGRERTNYIYVALERNGPAYIDEQVSYDSLAGQGVDTVLEISVRRYGLWSEAGINPPLSFFMTVTTKLIRLKDGAVLCNHTFRFEGQNKLKFTQWVENQEQPFRNELELSIHDLAEEIVRELFG